MAVLRLDQFILQLLQTSTVTKVRAEAKAYFVTAQTCSLYVSIITAVLLRFSEQLITKPQESVDLYVTLVGYNLTFLSSPCS